MNEVDIGADCAEKKRLIDKCRSEILALSRDESQHDKEISMEYKETYSTNEVTAVLPLIKEMENTLHDYLEPVFLSDSFFAKHERKRKLISLLKESITFIEEINSEYSKIRIQMSASKLRQRMTLDRALVDIGTTDENSIKTNHKDLEAGAYFSSFSKICDLNVEYDTTSNTLETIEELSKIVSNKYIDTCNCLNTLIDKKKVLEDKLNDMTKAAKNMELKPRDDSAETRNKEESKIIRFAKIGKNVVDNIQRNENDLGVTTCLSDILSALIKSDYKTEEDVVKHVDQLLDRIIGKNANSIPHLTKEDMDNVRARLMKLASKN